jgi:tryptophan-rich sensory protein
VTLDAILMLLAFVVPCVIAGAMGFFFPAPDYYRRLDRPGWSPPPWLFGPVWTLLYILIAIAGWRLGQALPDPRATPALIAWGVQIALNALWTPLFFGLRRPGLAFAEIVLL